MVMFTSDCVVSRSFTLCEAVVAAAVRKTVKGTGWTCDGLSALLYMCTESHVTPSKGLLVLWISVLELLSYRQRLSLGILLDRLHSLRQCPLILSARASLQRSTQEICPKFIPRPSWPRPGCARTAAWFEHKLGISAGVFEVACMQRPPHGAARSGRLLGMGFGKADCVTVAVFEVINRAGRAGWLAGRRAGAVNGISGTALVKLKRASSCLFHTKWQLTRQLVSIRYWLPDWECLQVFDWVLCVTSV